MTKKDSIEIVGHHLAGEKCENCTRGKASIEYMFTLMVAESRYVALCEKCAADLARGMLRDVLQINPNLFGKTIQELADLK